MTSSTGKKGPPRGPRPRTETCQFCKADFPKSGFVKHVRACSGIGEMTPEQIAERREKVWGLRLRGFNNAAIATLLKMNERMVGNDLRTRRQQIIEDVSTETVAERLAEEIALMKTIEEEAAKDYFVQDQTKAPAARIAGHREWRDSHQGRVEKMQQFGLLPKRPEEFELSTSGKDYRHMGRQALEEERRRILEKIQRLDPSTGQKLIENGGVKGGGDVGTGAENR